MRVVNRRSLYIKFLQTTSCDTLTSTCENSPPLMPVQRSHPGPKSCPAAAVDPYHAGLTDGQRAGRIVCEAWPPTHHAAHECSISASPAARAPPLMICLSPASHSHRRSGRVSGFPHITHCTMYNSCHTVPDHVPRQIDRGPPTFLCLTKHLYDKDEGCHFWGGHQIHNDHLRVHT